MDQIAEEAEKIRVLLKRVPAGISEWSWQKAVSYKEIATGAMRTLNHSRLSIDKLKAQRSRLEQFF